ncbi:MAG: sugar transferase [Lachnospiraceae bacterium]|nr:sugar transferase [Lachnospiraceae bacterium]
MDLIIIELSFAFAYAIRHTWDILGRDPRYHMGAVVVAAASAIWILFSDPYNEIWRRGYMKEFISVLRLLALVCVTLMVYLFFAQRGQEFSRLVVLYFAMIGSIALYSERIIWKRLLRIRKKTSDSIKHIFLISSSKYLNKAVSKLETEERVSVRVTGVALVDYDSGDDYGDHKVVRMENVIDHIQHEWVDAVAIYLDETDDKLEKIIDECALMGITIHHAFGLGGERYTAKSVEQVGSIYTLTESVRVVDSGQLLLKRIMDVIGAILGLLFTAVLTVVLGPLIFFADPGPVFYSQDRVGRNGRIFRIYKFRSMYKDADNNKGTLKASNKMTGPVFKMENDPRVLGSGVDGSRHGIGYFIRKHSLDEFPQFYNVLKGDMSLVGTRPPTIDEWEKYEARHRARLVIKPGLTGLWQVEGRSDITDFDKIVSLDMKYINEWTISGDIRLILKTVVEVFTGRGAK